MFHVLNRANARATIFQSPEDYAAFERVLQEAVERTGMRVLALGWHALKALRKGVARGRLPGPLN